VSVRVVAPAVFAAALLLAATGCGGSGSGLDQITVGAAKTYHLVDFKPSGPITPGKPTTISFSIMQPDGTVLKKFKTGPGPHTGVHLIFVRDDLSTIIHHHPPLNGTGVIKDSVTFTEPGPYRLVVDVYPAGQLQSTANAAESVPGVTPAPNFQLTQDVKVAGAYQPQPLPPPGTSDTIDGYHFSLTGASKLKAIQAQDVYMKVTGPDGKPVSFEPWFGALAHAIFFRKGSLDYFHTHVCNNVSLGCTSIFGGKKVVGTSSAPGELNVGVLLPASGRWRMFLQVQVDHRILTAPFTLHVG
jgi:hypothetical protein